MKRLLVLAFVVGGCSGGAAGLATEVPYVDVPLATEAPLPTDEPTAVADLPVKVTKRAKSVAPGADASLTITTAKKAKCDIDVEYESGRGTAKGLKPKTADSKGVITWKWMVGRNTNSGSVPITITCTLGDRTGSADTSFTVK